DAFSKALAGSLRVVPEVGRPRRCLLLHRGIAGAADLLRSRRIRSLAAIASAMQNRQGVLRCRAVGIVFGGWTFSPRGTSVPPEAQRAATTANLRTCGGTEVPQRTKRLPSKEQALQY